MAQKVVTTARGLKTFKNELTQPEGAMIKANDIVIDRDNIIEPRRGFALYGDSFGVDTDRAKQVLQYKDRILLHYDDKLAYDDGTGTFSVFSGSYSELDTGLRIKGKERNGNFYFTTATGVKKISATVASEFTTASAYIYDAGAARALDGIGLANTGTPGFMSAQSVVAYRQLWGYKDANENLVIGTPSSRIIVNNLSSVSTSIVDLEFTIPAEVSDDVKYFYQIYRSPVTDDSTTPGTAVPSDELQLVFEDFPTSTDFTNGYVSVSDITPEDFREGGVNLYTNPISGAGILQGNEKPPLCKGLADYRNALFFANTKTIHQQEVSLISTLSLSNGNTFILGNAASGDITFTFGSAENVSTKTILLATSGSVGQNIDATARSLVRVINLSDGPVYADYISGYEDVPGQMLFRSRTLDDVEFYIKVGATTSGAAFNPTLPKTNTQLSSNIESPNRVYYSKVNEPEAVPITNYFDVGSKDSPIIRIAALRDSLFIFKTDGIYRLSGTDTANFTVSLSDSSAIITAPDSLAILNNEIYFLSTQGVVVISESGQPRVISRDIEDLVLQPKSYSAYEYGTYGQAYESDRAYILNLPTKSTDTTATQLFRYNVFTQTWVRAVRSTTCSVLLNSDDKLYIGTSDLNQLEQERKNFDRTDYADREYDKSIVEDQVVDTTVKLGNLSNVNILDVLYQEMYITTSRFNRLLNKLDLDPELDDTDYFSSLELVAGNALNTKLASLVLKIAADDITQTYTTPSGSNDFTILKNEFNVLMTELNTSSGVFYANYISYTNTVSYESIILSKNSVLNIVTLLDTLPLLSGNCTVFSSIKSEVEYSPQTLGDVSLLKQFREATLMFDQVNFAKGTFTFRSDISDNYEENEFNGEGNGAFGSQIFGDKTYGGYATQAPHRTYVPRNKQRCRFILIGFIHQAAREGFVLTGYSVTYNDNTSERAYRS